VTLDEARALVGHRVVYHAYPGALVEEGTITSVGDALVFVRYGADTGSKATRPEDLEPVRGLS